MIMETPTQVYHKLYELLFNIFFNITNRDHTRIKILTEKRADNGSMYRTAT